MVISKIKSRLCEEFASFIRSLKLRPNQWDIFIGENNTKHIFYSNYGLVYISKCIKIDKLEIVERNNWKSGDCANQIPVKFDSKIGLPGLTQIKGFLNAINIITDLPSFENQLCLQKSIFYLEKTKEFLVYDKGNASITKSFQTRKLQSLLLHPDKLSFNHFNQLLKPVDIISEIKSNQLDELMAVINDKYFLTEANGTNFLVGLRDKAEAFISEFFGSKINNLLFCDQRKLPQ